MSVTYSITKKNNGGTTTHTNSPCFYAVYEYLKKYESLDVVVDKVWMKAVKNYKNRFAQGPGMDWGPFTVEDYKEYVRLLNLIGFKFSMKEAGNTFVFTIPLTENKTMVNKIILNAIRYLCEGNFPVIVHWFLKFAKEKNPGVSMYNKFILAHYFGYMENQNHSFIPYHSFTLLLSNKEVKEKILNNDSNSTVLAIIPQCTKPFQEKLENGTHKNHKELLSTKFKDGVTCKELLKEYKALCAKFM